MPPKSATKSPKRRLQTNGGQSGIYYVEDIVGKRVSNGQTAYLVKWRDYTHADNSWEPVDHLINCKPLIERFEDETRPPAPPVSSVAVHRGRPPKKHAVVRGLIRRDHLSSPTAAHLEVELDEHRSDSPALTAIREPLNLALLHDRLAKLENEWPHDRCECRTKEPKGTNESALTRNNVYVGVFPMIVGLVLAVIVGIIIGVMINLVSN